MADQRNWVSPYNYVQNNPIMRIDPNGALDRYSLDTESGDISLIAETDDETDELVDSETGETIVDEVDKGLLSDGQNIMKEGLETDNVKGGMRLALGISMYTHDEVGGTIYKNEGGDSFLKIYAYEHTTVERNGEGKVSKMIAGFAPEVPINEFTSSDGSFTGRASSQFHTHPGHPEGIDGIGAPYPSGADRAGIMLNWTDNIYIPHYIFGSEDGTHNGVTSNISKSQITQPKKSMSPTVWFRPTRWKLSDFK